MEQRRGLHPRRWPAGGRGRDRGLLGFLLAGLAYTFHRWGLARTGERAFLSATVVTAIVVTAVAAPVGSVTVGLDGEAASLVSTTREAVAAGVLERFLGGDSFVARTLREGGSLFGDTVSLDEIELRAAERWTSYPRSGWLHSCLPAPGRTHLRLMREGEVRPRRVDVGVGVTRVGALFDAPPVAAEEEAGFGAEMAESSGAGLGRSGAGGEPGGRRSPTVSPARPARARPLRAR